MENRRLSHRHRVQLGGIQLGQTLDGVRMNFLPTFIATGFGTGYLPKAPGTWGSLAALPFAWYLDISWAWIALVCFLGWIATYFYIQQPGKNQDPKEVVIDEVLGQWVTLMFAPKTLLGFALGFALFRLFDIWKPWPISWADQLKGSPVLNATSVMIDDVLAGLMAGIAFLLFQACV